MNDEAVLDHETCLVWQQSIPSTNPVDWTQAMTDCRGEEIGGRLGWRLPSVEELATLVDTENSEPALPSGHLFDTNGLNTGTYWTSTLWAAGTTFAWTVQFQNGNTWFSDRDDDRLTWCVRGGSGPSENGQGD